jgi:hypothetical protein
MEKTQSITDTPSSPALKIMHLTSEEVKSILCEEYYQTAVVKS